MKKIKYETHKLVSLFVSSLWGEQSTAANFFKYLHFDALRSSDAPELNAPEAFKNGSLKTAEWEWKCAKF